MSKRTVSQFWGSDASKNGMRGYYRDFFWHSVSKMTRSLLTALAATAFLAFSPLLFADTDEPPLHVATHGADVGDCLDEASPCRSIDYTLRRVGMSISRRRILRPALHSRADSPVLIIAGSNNSDGRFRTYSLANPASPAFLTAPATPPGQAGSDRLYMHDAALMIVTDARNRSQRFRSR
jgi:hypothetical protein